MEISAAQKRWMWRALGVFLLETIVIVAVNTLAHGWHTRWSISYYVGLETWSAVGFVLGNLVVAWYFSKYLYAVGRAWQMPRWYYWLIVIIGATLWGLSVCPLGYFARYGLGMADTVHKICSRTMFLCMLIVAIMFTFSPYAKKANRIWGGIFAVYGTVAAVAYLSGVDVILENMIFVESAYIFGFMLLSLSLQTKGEINGSRSKSK